MFQNFTDWPDTTVAPAREVPSPARPAPIRRADWPGPGPINLAIHDLPHASASLEWWYVNSHLRAAGGEEYSLFASFFRVRSGKDEQTGEDWHTHYLTWALTDVQQRKYHGTALLDLAAPDIAVRGIDEGKLREDPRMCRAL